MSVAPSGEMRGVGAFLSFFFFLVTVDCRLKSLFTPAKQRSSSPSSGLTVSGERRGAGVVKTAEDPESCQKLLNSPRARSLL